MPRISKEERKLVRARLLDSAARHFAEHGLAGANINRISLDAGYAKGTIYNYFASKEELFATILRSGSDVTVLRYRERQVEGDLRVHLLALAEEDVALVQKHEPFMQVIVRELLSTRPATREHLDAGLRPLMEVIVGLIDGARQRGELRTDLETPQLATLFVGQMTMLYAEHWRSDGVWPTWEQLPQLLVTVFFEGMKPR
ncbi:MAG: TetR/AcrR family transcriptional regulator [Myxococcota bacterium]